ncbi:MAG: hypothetical protein ACI9AQ_002052, partial [Dinoroseobacter sp.]
MPAALDMKLFSIVLMHMKPNGVSLECMILPPYS